MLLIGDWTGITLMDDKANEVRLPRSGAVSIYSDRHLDKTDPSRSHRVTVIATKQDTCIMIQSHASVIEAGSFTHLSLHQALTEAIQVERENKEKIEIINRTTTSLQLISQT